jgi:MarR family transcriptional regulator for hemolysin
MPTSLSSQRTITALLAPLGRAYRKHIDRAFLGFGVSHTLGLPVMLLGRLGDGVRQGALVEALGIEPPSLVPLLDAKTLHLTTAGRELAARAETAAEKVRSELLSGISPADLEITARVLARFQSNMESAG